MSDLELIKKHMKADDSMNEWFNHEWEEASKPQLTSPSKSPRRKKCDRRKGSCVESETSSLLSFNQVALGPFLPNAYRKVFERELKNTREKTIHLFRDEFEVIIDTNNNGQSIQKAYARQWLGLDYISYFGLDWGGKRLAFQDNRLVQFPGADTCSEREI